MTTPLKSLCLREHEVRALLKDGRVTVIREVEPQPPEWVTEVGVSCFTPLGSFSGRGRYKDEGPAEIFLKCPFGKVGEQRWVREEAYISGPNFCDAIDATHRDGDGKTRVVMYTLGASGESIRCAEDYGVKNSSAALMPRWASRITIQVEAVRCEFDGVWQWLGEMRRVEN